MTLKRLLLLISVTTLVLWAGPARAKVYIDLAAPAVKRLPIAVPEFRHQGPIPTDKDEAARIKAIGAELTATLIGDLEFSKLFQTIDPEAFLVDASTEGLTALRIDFGAWRAIGAQTLVKGGFSIEDKRLTVTVRLFDSITETQILGKRYVGSVRSPSRLAHYFADQLYKEVTGREGIFTTKLLFVSVRTGAKEVYVSDYDGRHARRITRNRSINLSPRWSPDGKSILYTSFKRGSPVLYSLNLRTGRDRAISRKKGINIGGRYSPDGKRVALTLSTKKGPELYLMELDSGQYKRLTDNRGIDVSPTWSPDGKKLAFTSDTSGNPHIFMLNLSNGGLKRLTYGGNYNSSPAWSPDGKSIAFSRSDKGRFNIWVMHPDGRGLKQLTFEGGGKSPSWSPDSRFIVYSSSNRVGSSLYIMRADGSGRTRLDTGAKAERTPAWSPFLN